MYQQPIFSMNNSNAGIIHVDFEGCIANIDANERRFIMPTFVIVLSETDLIINYNQLMDLFDVEEVDQINDEVRILCSGSEGPFVDSVGSILWAARELHGPNIRDKLLRLGIDDYKVVFRVCELL